MRGQPQSMRSGSSNRARISLDRAAREVAAGHQRRRRALEDAAEEPRLVGAAGEEIERGLGAHTLETGVTQHLRKATRE